MLVARRIVSTSALALALWAGGVVPIAHAVCPPSEEPHTDRAPRRVAQIALLLDTSNSMDGLINQAKSQLWSIVQRTSSLRHDGQAPILQIALYEYGNNSIDAGAGFVRQVLPFTTDLDLVSEKLFALSTNGGSEYCGTVIQKAARDLAWCSHDTAMRMLVVAGNEPFSQGSIDYRLSVPEATRRGIVVNTIHCGPRDDGIKGSWQDGAVLGKGTYFAIEQDKVIDVPTTPHDEEIIRCGTELNRTYLLYGELREESAARQSAQDSNAKSVAPAAAATRAAAKASANYVNRSWDLVDATEGGKFELLDTLKKDQLAPELQSLSKEQLKGRVEEARRQRNAIKRRIVELEALRAKELAAHASASSNTLGDALLRAIDAQAGQIGLLPEAKQPEQQQRAVPNDGR